jgi:hypothetical protein
MHTKLGAYYGDAAETLFYDGREGGYQGIHFDTWDLVHDELELEIENDSLREHLVEGLGDQTWCEADPALVPESQRLQSSWGAFCARLKHGRRYFFERERADEINGDDFDPQPPLTAIEVLEVTCKHASEAQLFKQLPMGTELFRARLPGPSGVPSRPVEFGPPPPEVARANRMSAEGIPMFYAALDPGTADIETRNGSADPVVAKFVLVRAATILDLSDIPHAPCMFDEHRSHLREPLLFLRRFGEDVSKPIERDQRVHVEYVPTQVIAEYLRFVFNWNGHPIDGVAFNSSRRRGGVCIALFADQDAVGGEPDLNSLEPKLLRFAKVIER